MSIDLCPARVDSAPLESEIDHASVLSVLWDSVYNQGNVDTLDHYLAPGYVRHGKSGDQDKPAVKAAVSALRAAFPDLHLTVHDVVKAGERLAVRWQVTGTHQAPYHGLPATSRSISIPGMTFIRFDDSSVAEEWVLWDDDDVRRSLGIISLGQNPSIKEQS